MNFLKNKFLLSLIIAVAGLLASTYLTILHYKNAIPPCSTVFGCEKVLTSFYSMIGPIPLALFGVIFYATVVILCLLIIVEGKKHFTKFFHFAISIGFLVSIGLFLIQFFLIHAFCEFCLLSEVFSLLLFVLSILKFKEDKESEASN